MQADLPGHLATLPGLWQAGSRMRTRTKKMLGGSALALVVLLAGLYLSSRGSELEARPVTSASPGASPRADRPPAAAPASSPDIVPGAVDEPAPAAPVLPGDPD